MLRAQGRIASRLAELGKRCRAAGMNVTPQRLAIYRALLKSEDHPTPEQLFARVRKELPSLSLATVYKVLYVLKQLGLVDEVSTISEAKRFDANHLSHHHLVCVRCDKVIDYYDRGFDALPLPRHLPGFEAQSLMVQINGLCQACARPE